MKRITAQLLSLAVLFSLSACGKTATLDSVEEDPRIPEILSAASLFGILQAGPGGRARLPQLE